MVAGHVSKDSWSRCETPSSLYDATRPNIVNRPAKPSVNSVDKNRDTIETIQRHLKKEMESKLQSKGLILPHESFVAVVQVGKYMFLAVMLPVYLCFYGIPRWVAANAIPKCFLFVKTHTLTIGRFAIEITKEAVNAMKGLIESMIGQALRMTKERARNLWKSLSFKFNHLIQSLSNMAKKPGLRLEKIKETLRKSFAYIYRTARQHAEATSQEMLRKGAFFAKRTANVLSQSFQAFERSVLNPFAEIVRQLMDPIRNFGRGAAKFLKSMKIQINRVATLFASLLKSAVKKGADASKQTFKKIVKPLLEALESVRELMKKALVKIKTTFVEPMIHALAPGWVMIKPYIEKSFIPFKKVFFFCRKRMQAIRKMFLASLKEKLTKQAAAFFGFSRSAKNVALGAISGCRQILFGAKTLVKKIWGMVAQAVVFLKQLLKYLVNLAAAASKKICRSFLSFLKGSVFILARIAFAAYVVVLIFWYAGLHGFYLAKHIANRHLA